MKKIGLFALLILMFLATVTYAASSNIGKISMTGTIKQTAVTCYKRAFKEATTACKNGDYSLFDPITVMSEKALRQTPCKVDTTTPCCFGYASAYKAIIDNGCSGGGEFSPGYLEGMQRAAYFDSVTKGK